MLQCMPKYLPVTEMDHKVMIDIYWLLLYLFSSLV